MMYKETFRAAKERLQRAADSSDAWERSGRREVSSLFNRLAKLNFPDFRSGMHYTHPKLCHLEPFKPALLEF